MAVFSFLTWKFFTKGQKGFLSFMSSISIIGVAIGVASLIIVVSVMAGFSKELERKILSGNPHIIIETGDVIENYSKLVKEIRTKAYVKRVAPMVSSQVFLQNGNTILTVLMRGIPNDKNAIMDFASFVRTGEFDLSGNGALIGEQMLKDYGYAIGDKITLLSPITSEPYTFEVRGIFKTGLYDYDASVVIVDINKASEMLIMPNSANMIAVDLTNPHKAEDAKSELLKTLSKEYPFLHIRTWIETNKNLFAALKLERLVMFLILTLIVIVASFNIASSLMVLVTEKTREIGILKALGVKDRTIYVVFLSVGLLIGVIGAFIGSVFAVIACVLMDKYKLVSLPPQIYYIDHLPVYLSWHTVIIVFGVAVLINLVSALYPARRASRLSAIEAIRYE